MHIFNVRVIVIGLNVVAVLKEAFLLHKMTVNVICVSQYFFRGFFTAKFCINLVHDNAIGPMYVNFDAH